MLSNSLTIYSSADEQVFLPYSILFDILNYFSDDSLNHSILEVLSHKLPRMHDYENEIDLWVDLESSGDITPILARELAQVMTVYFENNCKVKITIVINFQTHMTRDNNYFIDYLRNTSTLVKLIFSDDKNADFNASLIEDQNKYFKWIYPKENVYFDYDNNVENILRYAWACAELGSEEIGFRILEAGHKKSTDSYLKNFYLIQLQFMRVAVQYYEDAANESRSISAELGGLTKSFCLTKAWGSILIRRITDAGHYFALADVSVDCLPSDLNSLYRMNIFALYQYLSGRIDDALYIENKISNTMVEQDKSRAQIVYINSINLARLYRHINNYNQSKIHYDKAFATTREIRTESDFVYTNACYGMLYEKRGNFRLALQYWLKSAMHWLVSEIPEALGWRAVRAIANPNFKPRSKLEPDKITQALFDKLIKLCEKTNYSVCKSVQNPLKFVLLKNSMLLCNAAAYGVDGISIIVEKSAESIYANKNELEFDLMHLVSSLLFKFFNMKDQPFNTFIVDRTDGIEVPTDLYKLTRNCLLFSIPTLRFNDKEILFNEETRENLYAQLLIKPSESIVEMWLDSSPAYVVHKRYYKKNYLSDSEARLLEFIKAESSFSLIRDKYGITREDILHLMERKLISVGLNSLG